MQGIMTQHQNSEGLAKGLLPYIQTALSGATCRPWNRFESQETEWLLSPVREWPLVRPCKYYTAMTRTEDPTESRLVAGIYVEKGRTGDAAKMSKANERMDSRWGWHNVVTGFRSLKFPTCWVPFPNYEHRFKGSQRAAKQALGSGDTVTFMEVLFDRLYTLRNQLIHGGATWQSSMNRDQVRDGARILADLVPAMIHLVMENPHEDWGDICYPPMNGTDQMASAEDNG